MSAVNPFIGVEADRKRCIRKGIPEDVTFQNHPDQVLMTLTAPTGIRRVLTDGLVDNCMKYIWTYIVVCFVGPVFAAYAT